MNQSECSSSCILCVCLCVCVCVLALGAVRDAAGNVTLQDMQKLNEMKEALLSEKPEKQD